VAVVDSPAAAPGDVAMTRGIRSRLKVSEEAAPESEDAAAGLPAEFPTASPGRADGLTAEPKWDGTTAELAAKRTPSDRPSRPMREPVRKPRPQVQSGTLTAGSFDDVEHFDDYRQFLSESMQRDSGEQLPRLALGDRVMIRVRDAQGQPVGDARLAVHALEQAEQSTANEIPASPALAELVTGSDGRAVFLTGMDAPAHGRQFLVSATGPRGGRRVTQLARLDNTPWQIVLPDVSAELPAQLDLALVIDTTGSMSDELEYLKAEIDGIARAVYEMFPQVDQRYALVLYRDEGDQYVTRTFDFTGSLEDFRVKLSAQSAGGGGDYPEAVHLALEQAGNLSWRAGHTARVLFLVGDAPPHNRFSPRTLDAVRAMRSLGVRVYPVAGSGVALEAEFVMRAAAFLTMGQYLFLTDHSGVGLPHAAPHVPEYQVERLDRLMIRMIASELVGKRLAPAEVLAIERGDRDPRLDPGVVPPDQQQVNLVPAAAQYAWSRLGSWMPPRWTILALLVVLAFGFDAVAKLRS
jgi:hypothetical protein